MCVDGVQTIIITASGQLVARAFCGSQRSSFDSLLTQSPGRRSGWGWVVGWTGKGLLVLSGISVLSSVLSFVVSDSCKHNKLW